MQKNEDKRNINLYRFLNSLEIPNRKKNNTSQIVWVFQLSNRLSFWYTILSLCMKVF